MKEERGKRGKGKEERSSNFQLFQFQFSTVTVTSRDTGLKVTEGFVYICLLDGVHTHASGRLTRSSRFMHGNTRYIQHEASAMMACVLHKLVANL